VAAGPLIAIRRLCAAAIAALVLAVRATGTMAQEPVRRDSLVEALPDSVREEFGREVQREPRAFPERRGSLRGPATEVFECDRDCVAESPAFSLIDLLADFVPGLAPLRAGYYTGPHHAFDGPYGAGFVTLYVDGREIPSLERAQADLRALSLTMVERVRVYRDAAGFVIDVDTYRHSGPAYSVIGGGTGTPVETLQGVFANTIGTSMVVNGGFELLDGTRFGDSNDRFEAQARLSWMPTDGFGIQFEYRTESVDRSSADTADVRRKSMLLRARANVGERGQFELFGALSDYELKVTGLPEGEEAPKRGADVAGARISFGLGAGSASASARISEGGAYAAKTADLSVAYPLGRIGLEGGLAYGGWTGFKTTSWRAAAVWSDTLLVPLTLRVFGSGGDRGVGAPAADTAESVGYRAVGVGGALRLGPFDVSGRYTLERLDRQLGLAASFDAAALLDSAAVDMTSWEARLEGPIIPIGAIIPGLDPIRLRGFYRKNLATGALPLYVPEQLVHAELELHDTFFNGNLELWMTGYMERKGSRLVPTAGSPDVLAVSGYTWTGGQIMFKIGDFRFFYRMVNPGGQLAFDIPGADFPLSADLFGIRWEFFN